MASTNASWFAVVFAIATAAGLVLLSRRVSTARAALAFAGFQRAGDDERRGPERRRRRRGRTS